MSPGGVSPAEAKRCCRFEDVEAFPVSTKVLTPDFVALAQEKRWRPRQNDHGGNEKWNRLTSLADEVSLDGASCSQEYLLLNDGSNRLRLLQLLGILRSVPQSWKQLVVHESGPTRRYLPPSWVCRRCGVTVVRQCQPPAPCTRLPRGSRHRS